MKAPHTQPKTERLARRQNWLCIWCEFQMARDPDEAFSMARAERRPLEVLVPTRMFTDDSRKRFAKWVRASFDHVIPKAEGGTEAEGNGLAACRWCNNFRGMEDAAQFKERISAMVARGEHPRQTYRATGEWPHGMPRKDAIGNGAAFE